MINFIESMPYGYALLLGISLSVLFLVVLIQLTDKAYKL